MKYAAATQKLTAFRQQIADIRKQMRTVQAEVEPQEVADYDFRVSDGIVKLSELFGDHEDLMVVHNMGLSCPGCTLWADGYNGIHQHVTSRAAFVVSSPDSPEVQQNFAASRGWVFPMVSHMGNTFAQDMGYRTATRWLPGMSVFKHKGGKILRVSDVTWSPGDDFCTIWHMFDLLPEGPAGWMPKLRYSSEAATQSGIQAPESGTQATAPAIQATGSAASAAAPAIQAIGSAAQATAPAIQATGSAASATAPAIQAIGSAAQATAPASQRAESANQAAKLEDSPSSGPAASVPANSANAGTLQSCTKGCH